MSKRLFFLFHLNSVTKKRCCEHTVERQWPIYTNDFILDSREAAMAMHASSETRQNGRLLGGVTTASASAHILFFPFLVIWFEKTKDSFNNSHRLTFNFQHVATTAEPQKLSQGLAQCGRTNLGNVSMPFVMSQTNLFCLSTHFLLNFLICFFLLFACKYCYTSLLIQDESVTIFLMVEY